MLAGCFSRARAIGTGNERDENYLAGAIDRDPSLKHNHYAIQHIASPFFNVAEAILAVLRVYDAAVVVDPPIRVAASTASYEHRSTEGSRTHETIDIAHLVAFTRH